MSSLFKDYTQQFEQLFSHADFACLHTTTRVPYIINCHTDSLSALLNIDYPPDNLLDYIHPDDQERYQNELKDYLAQDDITHYQRVDFRIFTPQGDLKWLTEKGFIERDQNGRAMSLALHWQDITEAHLKQDAQQENENSFEMLLDSLNIGFFDYIFGTQTVKFSRTWKRQLGYEPYEIEDDFSEWEKRLPPEYIASAMQALDNHLHGRAEWYETIFPIRHKNGHQIWILAKGKVRFDPDGHPINLIATHTDLSTLKNLPENIKESAEIELQSEGSFRQAFMQAPIAMAMYNLSQHKAEINIALTEMLGYQSSDVSDRFYTEFIHPDDRQASIEHIERMIAGDTPPLTPVVRRALNKQGHSVLLRFTSYIATMENEDRILCSLVEDLTEATRRADSEKALDALLAQASPDD